MKFYLTFQFFPISTLVRLTLSILFLAAYRNSKADHIVGGEIQLIHQTGNQYLLTVNFYDSSQFDVGIYVSSFSKRNNSYIESFYLPAVNNTALPNTGNNCSDGNFSVRLIIYQVTITLDTLKYKDSLGYYISWERCCRNHYIKNIVDAESVGSVYYLEFPAIKKNGSPFYDSSPVFSSLSNIYACLNRAFYYSFGASDSDNDSLVYLLVTPLNGHSTHTYVEPIGLSAPYTSVTWQAGYSATNAIPGNPPLEINSRTGQLYVIPSDTGTFIFTVECDEYRNGVKIGEVRRDYEIYVDSCPVLYPPKLSLVKPDGNIYNKGDTLKISMDGNNNCYPLLVRDTNWLSANNSTQTVTIYSINTLENNITTGIGSTIFYSNGTNSPDTANLCITASCINGQKNTSGIYEYTLVAQIQVCPLPLYDTLNILFYIIPDVNYPPQIGILPDSMNFTIYRGDSINFSVYASDKNINDSIILNAYGVGFNLKQVGISFNSISGIDSISTIFSWIPSCENLKEKQSYQIYFIAKDNHCINPAKDSILVTINLKDIDSSFSLKPPNIVTPNNDGKNDIFHISDLPKDNCQNKFVKIEIYNRWGDRVFESDSRDFSWNPANCTDGVYFYSLEYTNNKIKDWIFVIR